MTSPTPPNPSNVSPPFVSSPAGSSFVPRREFAPQPLHHPSTFGLLAFSSNNVLRFSNFPPAAVNDLRTRLGSIVGLHSFRENAEHKLCEIVLTGKPWSNNRSLSTEVLLVQVFSVILAHGYSLLSQLHYGREHNDRLTFAFMKTDTPSPPRPLTPFALSFTSSTSLRVVCSPLHATPAILQSVRGAWPRGVLSEKKIGEHCYEFKLKGYSWFQEDTFAEDALAHMLTLLSSLDKHNWSFITSVPLSSNHSRNRDLWIFAGPSSAMPSVHAARPATPVNLGSPLKPSVHEPIIDHRREGSDDSDPLEGPHHVRSATEPRIKAPIQSPERAIKGTHARSTSDAPALLRKKGPSEPLSSNVNRNGLINESVPELLVADSATTSPEEPSSGQQSPHTPLGDPPRHSLVSLPEAVDYIRDDDDNTKKELGDDNSPNHNPPVVYDVYAASVGPEVPTPPLLGPTAFRRSGSDDCRNSTFSETTRRSFDVPLAWIPSEQRMPLPVNNTEQQGKQQEESVTPSSKRLSPSAFPEAVDEGRRSLNLLTPAAETPGPLPPGGWFSTPTVEVENPTDEANVNPTVTPRKDSTSLGPKHSIIISRSPQIVNPELPENRVSHPSGPRRKSESGVIGRIGDSTPLTPTEPLPNGQSVDEASATDADPPTNPKRIVEGSWVVVDDRSNSRQSTRSHTTPSGDTGGALQEASAAKEDDVLGSLPTEFLKEQGSRPGTPGSRPDTPSKSDENAVIGRKERSMLGRLLSRRGGSRRGKGSNSEEDSDREKSPTNKLKKSGSILPAIRSGKRISVD